MLLSLSWRFAFVSNMKAASTTIEHSLCDFAELQRIFPRNSKHFSFAQIQCAFPVVFRTPGFGADRFVKFGVIRDPRSWLCSWFNYRSREELADPRHGQHDQYVGTMTFDQFAAEVVLKRPRPFGFVRLQSSILADDGAPNCDFVVRFESFDADMADLVAALGLPETWPQLRRPRNRTDHVRLRPADVDWRAYPELTSFLEPDMELRERYLAQLPAQIDRIAHMRKDFVAPDGPRSTDPAIQHMLGLYWESYGASVLYGPTRGVPAEQAEAEVTRHGRRAFFPIEAGA